MDCNPSCVGYSPHIRPDSDLPDVPWILPVSASDGLFQMGNEPGSTAQEKQFFHPARRTRYVRHAASTGGYILYETFQV